MANNANDTQAESSSVSLSLSLFFSSTVQVLEGLLMVLGNTVLVYCIFSRTKLRKKGLISIGGLAFGDAIYGKKGK